jgi:hypothetical protein
MHGASGGGLPAGQQQQGQQQGQQQQQASELEKSVSQTQLDLLNAAVLAASSQSPSAQRDHGAPG